MAEIVRNRVFQFRAQKEVTQEELAKAAGVTRQTIITIEKGNYAPSVLLALKIAKYFRKSVEDVFFLSL